MPGQGSPQFLIVRGGPAFHKKNTCKNYPSKQRFMYIFATRLYDYAGRCGLTRMKCPYVYLDKFHSLSCGRAVRPVLVLVIGR